MKTLTNYERVARFNAIAGNAFGEGWDQLERQLKIVKLERNELDEGIATRNVIEIMDGAADEIVTVYGMLYRLGVDGDAVMSEVLDGLETRFDTTHEDALKTVKKYKTLGVESHIHSSVFGGISYYVVKVTHDQVGNDDEEYPRGKWLKSYNFREPNLKKFIYDELLARLDLTISV